MNRLIFRSFDGTSMRYDVTGFEHGIENEMSGVFLDGAYYKIVEKIDPQEGDMHPSAIVEQFTGLLDKNGVKIFEGDIVKLHTIEHEKGGWRSNEKAQGVIEFNDVWGVRFICKDFTQRTASAHFKMKSLTSREVTNIKVIGNIHSNPDLLEKK